MPRLQHEKPGAGSQANARSQLEEHLGVDLFERHGRHVQPTTQARLLLRSLQQAFELIGATCDEMQNSRLQSQLHIAVTAEIAQKWLVGRLAGFSEWYPQTVLHLHEQALEALVPSPDMSSTSLLTIQRLSSWS